MYLFCQHVFPDHTRKGIGLVDNPKSLSLWKSNITTANWSSIYINHYLKND